MSARSPTEGDLVAEKWLVQRLYDSGYDLLKQLAECSPQDLDTWNQLMKKFSASTAELILSELSRRLRLIEKLQQLIHDKKTDELHDLQPLFEQGLWMFGPEYESVEFRSNLGLATIIREMLGGTEESIKRGRTDFVALPNRRKLAELRRQATRVEQQQDTLLKMRLAGEIEQDAFSRQSAELRDRRSEIEARFNACNQGRAEDADIASKAFELSQNLKGRWVTADYAEKRRILEIVCLNFSLVNASLVPTWRKPFDVLAERQIFADGIPTRIGADSIRPSCCEIHFG